MSMPTAESAIITQTTASTPSTNLRSSGRSVRARAFGVAPAAPSPRPRSSAVSASCQTT
jgi:hypothetical protein